MYVCEHLPKLHPQKRYRSRPSCQKQPLLADTFKLYNAVAITTPIINPKAIPMGNDHIGVKAPIK